MRVREALEPALSDAVAAAIVDDASDPRAYVANALLVAKKPSPPQTEQPPAAAEPADGEVDRDHVSDGERPQPTTEMLWPRSVFVDRFSLLVSRHAFDGWVAQPSPCCAAASVAGACNAVLGLPHDAPAALSHLHVAALYHGMLSEHAAKRSAGVARLLGVDSIDPVLEAFREALNAEGRSLGGRKEKACKGKEALARLRDLCEAKVAEAAASAATQDGAEAAAPEGRVWSALWEVVQSVRGGSGGGGVLEEVAPAQAQAKEGAAEDDEDAAEDEAAAGGGDGAGFGTRVRSELKTLFSKLGGCEQLAPEQPRLATTYIGNWGMHAAVRSLQGAAFDAADADADAAVDPRLVSLRSGAVGVERAALCARLRCRTLVGLRIKGSAVPPILLRKADDDDAIEAAWVALKAAFSAERCCLLLHQKNHYSLVFAMREWVEDDAAPSASASTAEAAEAAEAPVDAAAAPAAPTRRRVREVLTCRKGQRPTLWIDWREIHGYITGWSGYAIMEITAE